MGAPFDTCRKVRTKRRTTYAGNAADETATLDTRDVGLGMLGKKSRDFLTAINTFYQVFSVITTYYNVYQLLKLLPVNIVSPCF